MSSDWERGESTIPSNGVNTVIEFRVDVRSSFIAMFDVTRSALTVIYSEEEAWVRDAP
jgi:hypothetical protein